MYVCICIYICTYIHVVQSLCSRLFPNLSESWCTRETMHFHIRAIYANYCMKLKSFRGKRWCAGACTITSVHDDTRGRERRVVWREGLVWLFTVGANNFCKSISFRGWNIKRPRERYIKACSIFANRNHANQFVSLRFFSLSLSFCLFHFLFSFFTSFFFFGLFQRDTFIFFGNKLLFYIALFFNVFFVYAGINIIALRVNS